MDSPTKKPSHVDPELKTRLVSLYVSMAKRLGIQKAPKIIFTQSVENAKKPFGLTAFYNQQDHSIKVYVTGRHPTDILRSFAHELIHHWQNEHGALPPDAQKSGHAHYAQKSPVLRQREMEAYLLGNILFRDWQDENRYGSLNESIFPSDANVLKEAIRKTLFDMIKEIALQSFEEETKHLSRQELKAMVMERIEEMGKKKKYKQKNQNYAQWLKQFLAARDEKKKAAAKYYHIGFNNDDMAHYCWYWDGRKIVMQRGGGHLNNFGKDLPYKSFRGRYDMKTKELSLAVPEYGKMKITGNMEQDVPPELLRALNKTFHNPKIFYFPHLV